MYQFYNVPFAVLCVEVLLTTATFWDWYLPEQLPPPLNHSGVLLKLSVAGVFIRFEIIPSLFIIQPCAVLKKQVCRLICMTCRLSDVECMPHTWASWNRWSLFVLITTIAVITVLNLFFVVTCMPLTSAQISCLCGSPFLNSVLFKVTKQDSPGRIWQITNLWLHCAFVFWFVERVSLCSSDWHGIRCSPGWPQSYAFPPVGASKILGLEMKATILVHILVLRAVFKQNRAFSALSSDVKGGLWNLKSI